MVCCLLFGVCLPAVAFLIGVALAETVAKEGGLSSVVRRLWSVVFFCGLSSVVRGPWSSLDICRYSS